MVWFVENKQYISEEELAFLFKFAFLDYNFAKKKDGYSIKTNDWKKFNLILKLCDVYGISIEGSYLKGEYWYDIETMKKSYTKTFYTSFKKLLENSFSLNDLKNLSHTKDEKELKRFKLFYLNIFFKLSYDFEKISRNIKNDLNDYIDLYINRQLKNRGSRKVAYEYKKEKLHKLLLEQANINADVKNNFSLKSKSLMDKGMVNDFDLLFFHDSLALCSDGFIKNIRGISYNQDREKCSVSVFLGEGKNKYKRKPAIVISEESGIIYKEGDEDKVYIIKIDSKRFSILKMLYSNKDRECKTEELSEALYKGDDSNLTKEIGEVNRLFRNNVLGILKDIQDKEILDKINLIRSKPGKKTKVLNKKTYRIKMILKKPL